jgi:hypothetical protein
VLTIPWCQPVNKGFAANNRWFLNNLLIRPLNNLLMIAPFLSPASPHDHNQAAAQIFRQQHQKGSWMPSQLPACASHRACIVTAADEAASAHDAVLAAAAAAAAALHAGLCCFQCATWHPLLQYLATRQPEHLLDDPTTSCCFDRSGVRDLHRGLLQTVPAGMLHSASPGPCSSCASTAGPACAACCYAVAADCRSSRIGSVT